MEISRILIIDDDPQLRKTLADILRVKGYEVMVAKDGSEGLAILGENAVNLTIVDLGLPDISGLEVLNRIKGSYPSMEVIILTGNATLDTAIEAINRGAFSYLVKPYEMEQLLLNIRRAIEKQQAENTLKENELRLKILFDSQPSCILVVDAETHTITDANPAAVRLIGSSKEKIVGSLCHRFVCPAEVGECPITDLGMKIENSDRELLNAQCETVSIVKTVASIMLNGRECLIESFIDITELKKLNDEVNRIHNLESIGLLAGGLAHDFNNVLNIIYGNITYSRMMAGENEAITEPLRDAEEACERAKELGVRLQIFSQGGCPAKEPITLPKVIDNAAGTVFNNSKIMHNITVAADLFPLEADPRQIRQVFENLLINAKEAMVDGGTVNIDIKNCVIDGKEGLPLESGSYICIALQDEGKGIPEDILPKIFDPYFSTKDTYSQKGLGLGLSICHSVIKRHRGHISIDSKVGVGTKVTVYLPASAESVIVEDRACTRGVT
jgi:signal transduction histidine kinase